LPHRRSVGRSRRPSCPYFTGELAPRPAKSLFASPSFAPAAEMWPRIGAVDAVAGVVRRRPGVAATTSQTPLSLQRRKRWYTLVHLPSSQGVLRESKGRGNAVRPSRCPLRGLLSMR
jgi:hypothetical protein